MIGLVDKATRDEAASLVDADYHKDSKQVWCNAVRAAILEDGDLDILHTACHYPRDEHSRNGTSWSPRAFPHDRRPMSLLLSHQLA